MSKKFIIKDEDGKEFEITEKDVKDEDEEVKDEDIDIKDDETLMPEEIAALKELAKHSAEIIALLSAKKDSQEEKVLDEDEEIKDEDEEEIIIDEDESKKEEVIDTKSCDSKRSVGSLERKTYTNDSVDKDLEISNAWSNRYKNAYSKKEL